MGLFSKEDRIPHELTDSISKGRCALFLGAGASIASRAPTGRQLAQELSEEFLDGCHSGEPLPSVASYIEQKPGVGRLVLLRYLLDRLKDLEPNRGHYILKQYPWAGIYTTNYDDLIERAYESDVGGRKTVHRVLRSADLPLIRDVNVRLLKLHGCLSCATSAEVPIVISEEDYVRSRDNRRAMFNLLLAQRYEFTFLFAGFSFTDSDLGEIWDEVFEELGNLAQWSYGLWPGCSQEQRDQWREKNVVLIDMEFVEFFRELERVMRAPKPASPEPPPVLSIKPSRQPARDVLRTLWAVQQMRSTHTVRHIRRVIELIELIGSEMKLSRRDMMDLRIAAVAHDIGKLAIPDSVLDQTGALTDSEWQMIKSHTTIGEELLLAVSGMRKAAAIVRSHHERPDGRGYPLGLRSDDIPVGARILAIADCFDAMAGSRWEGPRSYRSSLPIEQASAQIRKGSGNQFFPDVVSAFERVAEKHDLVAIMHDMSCDFPF